MKTRLFILLLLFGTVELRAQRDDFIGCGELLFSAGGMNYLGDLNGQSAFGTPNLAYGFGFRYRIDTRWALRGEFSMGRVASGDDIIPLRNLGFRSDITELSLVAEFNFTSYGEGRSDGSWTPYLFGGLAVFHFDPMAQVVDADGAMRWVELQPLHTEGQASVQYPDRKPYLLFQVSMPFGVGVKCRLGRHCSLSAEYGFRKTWTDYLDDVSKTYVEAEVLRANYTDGELAAQLADRSGEVRPGYVNAPGIKRGDDSLDDWYAYFHVSFGLSLEPLLGWTRRKKCKL